jgi:hypothetical protein
VKSQRKIPKEDQSMKLSGKRLQVLGLTACLGVSAHAAENWVRAESEHFVITSSTTEAKTVSYVQKLEAFRTLTNMLLGGTGGTAQAKFQIYLLDDPEQMKVVRPNFADNVGGVYFHCSEGSSAYAKAPGYGQQQDNLTILFHEYAHHVTFQHARTYYPAWFIEGFAEYLSTAYPARGSISIGETSTMRSYTLGTENWIGFDKILDPKFRVDGDKDADARTIWRFYAQSWLLAHYMLSDPARTKALYAYFTAVGGGGDPIASWESATGIKIDTLHRVLQRYSENMLFMNVPVADYPESSIRVTRLPKGSEHYVLKASLLTTCPTWEYGKTLLASIAAQKTALAGDPQYRLELAKAQLLFGELGEAETALTEIHAARPDDFAVNYLMGRVRFAQSERGEGAAKSERMDQARAFFIAAYRANKLDAPNLYYLARSFGNKPNYPDANVLNAADSAHYLAPAVWDYAFFDFLVNLLANRRDKAAAALAPLGNDPHNPAQAARVQKALEATKAGMDTNQVLKLLSASPPASP